jgi:type IV pilus assembly protein PilA
MIKKIKGFTLIELLVVIAIIGILSAVVIGNLNNAKEKGLDASAKASMSSLRAEAEIIYDTDGSSYDEVCTSGSAVDVLHDAATTNGVSGVCNDSADAYAADVLLNDGNYFCVDSTGFAGAATATLGTATVCS